MRLENLLWQRAAEAVVRDHGWLCQDKDRKRDSVSKNEWGVFLQDCNNHHSYDDDEPCKNCQFLRLAKSYVVGAQWMIHRCKPLIVEKVVEDLIEQESPYYDSPAFFDPKD